jgi:ATP adenylyltransferase/5',5'''-P-1,P-4-tetraphosphate phosphorylase II
LAETGYNHLESVQTREFEFDDFVIKVQFNSARITSSSAKVDKKSIESRKCFLCYKSLPEYQKGIPYFRDYLILVNPFPIFPEHFTIPKIDHVPQLIDGNLQGMLKLTKDIGKYYTVFYNGPKCGASAPDHMHFQAGNKDFMPIDSEIKNLLLTKGETIYDSNGSRIVGLSDYLRKLFYIESEKLAGICELFKGLYSVLRLAPKYEEEPMMNIISFYDQKKWKVIVFPRIKHRPDYYFKDGNDKILLSPASVDFGGVCITPREEDFNKISKKNIIDIFRQVSISNEYYEFYKTKIKEAFAE